MKLSSAKIIVPLLVALIGAAATLGSAVIGQNPKHSPTLTPTISSHPTNSECNQNLAQKICIANATVQINSDEPQQVKFQQRLPLQAGDTLKVLNLRYCIPPSATVNKVETKVFMFKNEVENYQYGLFTPSTLPTNIGCHNVGNFQSTWKLEPGQHKVVIPTIKHDGSNRVVNKSFYFHFDVGQ